MVNSTELHNDLSSFKEKIEKAMKISMSELDKIDMGHTIDDFVYEDMNQIYNFIADDDRELIQAVIDTAKKIAKELYAHEDCWNMRLPSAHTKVIGHDFTYTEWLRIQFNEYAKRLEIYLRHNC